MKVVESKMYKEGKKSLIANIMERDSKNNTKKVVRSIKSKYLIYYILKNV